MQTKWRRCTGRNKVRAWFDLGGAPETRRRIYLAAVGR